MGQSVFTEAEYLQDFFSNVEQCIDFDRHLLNWAKDF